MRFIIWIPFHLVRYITETLLLRNCVFCSVFAVTFAHFQCIVYQKRSKYHIHRSHESFFVSFEFNDFYWCERSFSWLQKCTFDAQGNKPIQFMYMSFTFSFSSFIHLTYLVTVNIIIIKKKIPSNIWLWHLNEWWIYRLKSELIMSFFITLTIHLHQSPICFVFSSIDYYSLFTFFY